MKWGVVIMVTFIIGLIVLYEWPKINQDEKKEKITFAVLTLIGWGLAVILAFFPEMPGPTDMVNKIYNPLSQLLE